MTGRQVMAPPPSRATEMIVIWKRSEAEAHIYPGRQVQSVLWRAS